MLLVYEEKLGIAIPDVPVDERDLEGVHDAIAHEAWRWRRVESLAAAEPFDVCLFRVMGQYLAHIGVYARDRLFLHACREIGPTCVNSLSRNPWRHTLEGIYRWQK